MIASWPRWSASLRGVFTKNAAPLIVPTLLERIRTQFPASTLVWLYPDLPKQYDEVIALVEQTGGELNFNDALIALACRDRNIPYLA